MKVKLSSDIMLLSDDLERLIAEKRHEIEAEKIGLGLLPPRPDTTYLKKIVNQDDVITEPKKRVRIEESRVRRQDVEKENKKEIPRSRSLDDSEEISPELERYIRRYMGLPVMLKAGEYSPNNPLVRGERSSGDVLLGIGEYERRRNTLRKLRQQQYREYLDQQAKVKQEAKEQADRERREREERERLREEQLERERREIEEKKAERRASVCHVPDVDRGNSYNGVKTRQRVDMGVQVGIGRPLSVAVQTDDSALYGVSSPTKCQLTLAERELSPRTVVDSNDNRPIQPAPWAERGERRWETGTEQWEERRRSYGDFDERTSTIKQKSNRDKLVSDLRHSYMPSIFDADAIHMRNLQAEKEAAERRQFYQQELKNQIQEQQRIREERKTREKMLEQAEMRRLEEQLKMLRVAQDKEVTRQHDVQTQFRESARDFEKKRTLLQKDIDAEQQKLHRAPFHPHAIIKRQTYTSQSDNSHKKQPKEAKKPYSTNIPDGSIFNPNYDVESYLRKNLNPTKESLMSNRLDTGDSEFNQGCERNLTVEAQIHEYPRNYKPSISRRDYNDRRLGNAFEKSDSLSDLIHVRQLSYPQDDPFDNKRYLDTVQDNYGNSQDRSGNVYDRSGNIPDRSGNIPDRSGNVYDRSGNVHDRSGNVYDRSGNVHDRSGNVQERFLRENLDETPIPVLRHSPKSLNDDDDVCDNFQVSDAMKMVSDKWEVPAVQKNILKSSNEEGKNVNILTQLGSIRRQLQLEQLKLDGKLKKFDG